MTTDYNPYLASSSDESRPIVAPPVLLAAPSSAAMTSLKVPGYVVDDLLGVGGFGEVWRARSRATGELVAIKCVPATDGDQLQRALQEASLLAALRHPHLIALHEVVQVPGAVALVLGLAERGSLQQLLEVRERLTAGETITAVAPVAAAVAHAHRSGVVHGDITPANVLFSERGDALLADLGMARIAQAPSRRARVVSGFAATQYLPTTTDDVHALGVLAYRCLTGTEPGNAEQQRHALTGIRAVSGLSTDLADAVLRALSSEPVMRGTAADFALAVRASGTPLAIDFGAGGGRPVGPARPAPTRLVSVPPRPELANRKRPELAKRTLLSRVRGALLG
jgi:serine/threonine protein kinase